MSDTVTAQGPRPAWLTWLLSVLAVLAGVLVVVAFSIGADLGVVKLGMFPAPPVRPPDGLFLEPLVYRSAFAVLGAYITARLAPRAPVTHALVLGGIGVAVSLMGAVMTGGRNDMGPAWYSWALVITTLPLTWLGGVLHRRAGEGDHEGVEGASRS
jgi:hypothetical protein